MSSSFFSLIFEVHFKIKDLIMQQVRSHLKNTEVKLNWIISELKLNRKWIKIELEII